MDKKSGDSSPARRTRGQRVGLSREQVLEAAIHLADQEGLTALTMRRLAAELDVEAMTLYHHVPGKQALLDGIVERLVAQAVSTPPATADWQESLSDYARALRAGLLAHPAIVPLLLSRPALTTLNLATLEQVLGSLHAAGFRPGAALNVVYSVTELIVGQATTQAGSVARDTRTDRDVAPETHPLLAAALRESDDPAVRFDLALAALVTGLTQNPRPTVSDGGGLVTSQEVE